MSGRNSIGYNCSSCLIVLASPLHLVQKVTGILRAGAGITDARERVHHVGGDEFAPLSTGETRIIVKPHIGAEMVRVLHSAASDREAVCQLRAEIQVVIKRDKVVVEFAAMWPDVTSLIRTGSIELSSPVSLMR